MSYIPVTDKGTDKGFRRSKATAAKILQSSEDGRGIASPDIELVVKSCLYPSRPLRTFSDPEARSRVVCRSWMNDESNS